MTASGSQIDALIATVSAPTEAGQPSGPPDLGDPQLMANLRLAAVGLLKEARARHGSLAAARRAGNLRAALERARQPGGEPRHAPD